MSRGSFTYLLISLLMPVTGLSQLPAQPAIPGYTYHPMKEDKPSWQRLTLLLSATFLIVVKEGQGDIDSCMQAASRSMGLSRYAIMAEGFDSPDLARHASWIDQQQPGKGASLLPELTGKKHLQLLLLLGAYYAFQPHNYSKYRDSVEYFLHKAIRESRSLKEDKLGRQALALLVKMYALGNDPTGDSVYNVLISQCRQAGDKDTEARVLAWRSKYTPPMATTIERKIQDVEQAAAIYHSLGNPEGEINALTDLGYLRVITGQLDLAYELLLKAFNLAEAIHFPYTHYNGQALASIAMFQGKYGEPLRYVYQTIRTAEATRDSIAWGYFYTNLAHMFNWEGSQRQSNEWALKAINRFVAERNTSVYRIVNLLIFYRQEEGNAQETMNLLLDISRKVGYPTTFSDQFCYHEAFATGYLGLHLPDQAEWHIKKMDSLETGIAKVIGPMRRTEVNTQYGRLFMARKQYRKAREYYSRQFIAPGNMDASLGNTIATYLTMIQIDSALGDNASAVEHYRKYVQLSDSNFQIARTRQAEELQVNYQMHEKQNEIKALTQQANLEKANSEKAALVRNLTIVGIFAVLVIAGLLYRQSRLRKKNNEVISQKNAQLQQLLEDKEWLLREIHHRVKNNLQIVMSLLDSQSEYIDNDAALAAIEDNMRRVHAMALIHQKLYQSDDIAFIPMQEYINELVSYARESFNTGFRIGFKQTVEPLDLDVSQAIPLGLIINESIVNAIKYAFPDGRKGTVCIHFYKDGPDHLVLQIADDGAGLPPGFNTKTHTSLGFQLMQGLTRQLNGNFVFESSPGLHITIRFPVLSNYFSQRPITNLQATAS